MNWNEYPKKESMPADEDELMQLEQQSGTNKTIRLIYFFNWILSKLKQHEFALNTESKTIENAINEVDATAKKVKIGLDSKADGKGIGFTVSKAGNLQVTYDDGRE